MSERLVAPHGGLGELRVGDRRLTRERTVSPRAPAPFWRDLLELTKPSITAMNVLMTVGAYFFADPSASLWVGALAFAGTALAVGSANTLNQVLERESDKQMKRTCRRPLPDGRLSVRAAVIFGAVQGAVAIAVLGLGVNWLTAGLGAFALVSYVWVYTPLKRRSPSALIVGAVPGAMPPLMGWTAATGRLDAAGLVLFAILLLWQLPHFLAIAIYCEKDYARVGIRALSVVRGVDVAKRHALAYAVLLVVASLALVPLDAAGWLYLAAAAGLGGWFVWVGAKGLRPEAGVQWARGFFLASLVYLPALTLALMVDTVVGL